MAELIINDTHLHSNREPGWAAEDTGPASWCSVCLETSKRASKWTLPEPWGPGTFIPGETYWSCPSSTWQLMRPDLGPPSASLRADPLASLHPVGLEPRKTASQEHHCSFRWPFTFPSKQFVKFQFTFELLIITLEFSPSQQTQVASWQQNDIL